MTEQYGHNGPFYDPRLFPSTPLGRLGASPPREGDPAVVGPYAVVASIGGGGMGRIFLGRDSSGRPGLAAVKVIRPEYAEDAQFRRRFEREATALARVQGDHTAVFLGADFDRVHGGLLWMATEYIPGYSLSDAVSAYGPMGPAAAWRLAADIGRAVGAMGQAGVVHRDLKPGNVVLGPDGARVIDFGIAQAAETSSITVTGQQVGTPAYMSPEQVRGMEVNSASDVFSLGSVLAFAVAGSAPFGDGTAVEVLHRVAFEPPKEEVLAEVHAADPELARLVAGCLEKEPEQRLSPEAVVRAAEARQAASPWSEALSGSILTRVQAAGEVQTMPLPAGAAAAVANSPTETMQLGRLGQHSGRTPVEPTEPSRVRGGMPPRRPSRRGWLIGGAAAAVAAVVTAVVLLLPGSGQHGTAVTTGTASSPSTAPSVAPSSAPATAPGQPGASGSSPAHHLVPPPPEAQLPGASPAAATRRISPPPAQPVWDRDCTEYSGTALTQQGATGAPVVEVQCILAHRGYSLGSSGVDGQFGPATTAAVKKFQTAKGLAVDGQVGPETWKALRART